MMTNSRLESIGRLLCLIGAMLGVVGLFGSITGVTALTTMVPGLPPMVPNTAVGVVLLGIGGALLHRQSVGRASRAVVVVVALVVLLIGAGTLAEYWLELDLHIDQLLLRSSNGPYPGRPSPLTALALVLLSIPLLVFDSRPTAATRPSEWLILAAFLVAFVSLTGIVFGAGELYRMTDGPVMGVGLPTAVSLLSTSAGLLLERPGVGIMRVVTSPGPGGIMLRRLAPPTLLVPLLLGLVVMQSWATLDAEHDALPFAMLAASTAVGGVVLLAVTAVPLNRTHEALESARRRFELALEGANLAAWDWNVETGEVLFNARWSEMRGFQPDEVEPHVNTWSSSVHPDDWPLVQKALDDHFEGLTDYSKEFRVRTKSGDWIWILDRGRVFERDEAGRPTRMVGTELDITERKRFEEALSASEHEEKFLAEVGAVLTSTLGYEETAANIARLAVGELADVCIVKTVDEGGQVHRLSVAHRDPSKAELAACLERIPLDARRPYVGSEVLDTLEPCVVEEVTPELLESVAQSDEHLRAWRALDPKSLVTLPLVAHGRLVGLMILVRTTAAPRCTPSDRRLAEEVARRAAFAVDNARLYQAAQRAIQARDDVLGIVAHDLRNPLGIIQMQALLLRYQASGPQHAVRKAADTIERSVARMTRLIQDLLDVTCMEAGRLSIERARVQTDELVREVVETQRSVAAAAPLELRLDLAAELPPIWADPHRLLQVFENLIGNAVKLTTAGGCITVGAAPRSGEVLFWVADTGPGIPAEDLPHLFDRFWQAPREKRRGAGLGLPIVKGIVEAHGGRVWVQSSVGTGSTFLFTIPTQSPQ